MALLILTLFRFMVAKILLLFCAKNDDSDFAQKYRFLLPFFGQNLVKQRRTEKRPTVLSSLQPRLTICITFRKIYFFDQFSHFSSSSIFAKNRQKLKFSGLNANR